MDFKFQKIENLEKIRKALGPTCQLQRPLKRLTPVTRACASDTVCSDMVVTIRCWWPPPHVIAALSSCNVEQSTVSPISPSSTCTPRHISALPLTGIKALGASHLCPLPGLNVASPSFAFTPRCSSTWPPAPSTTSPCSRHQFTSTPIPPQAHRQPAAPAICRPRPCLHEHRPALEYLGTHFNSSSTRFSGPSLALPYVDHHRHREPSSGEPPPRLTPQ
jgi:hypothetical protein